MTLSGMASRTVFFYNTTIQTRLRNAREEGWDGPTFADDRHAGSELKLEGELQ